jgi:IclR family pca regulon transcriptional regulator
MKNPVQDEGDSDPNDGERDRNKVQSLASGLAVMRAFDAAHPTLTISEVAEITGLGRASARRFLLTLEDLGYVRQSGRRFTLGPQVLELAAHYLGAAGVPEIARPHMERLAETTSESCSLAVLDGLDIVYVQRVTAPRIVRVMINIGTRFPAYSTSMGRVLISARSDEWVDGFLAKAPVGRPNLRIAPPLDLPRVKHEIQKIRELGYCLMDGEMEPALRMLAVPVRDGADRTVASMAIANHDSTRTADDMLRDILPPLQAAAHAVERDVVSRGVTAFFG